MEPLMNRVGGSVSQTVQFHVLYLFSGPERCQDGFQKFCSDLGMKCTCLDIEYNPKHDLLCQDVWEDVQTEMDRYDAYLMSPPCSTFSMARTGMGGPAPLRGISGKDRYGLRHLSIEDKAKVKEGTLLSRRAHSTAQRAQTHEKPWVLEQPHWREDGTSMFMLDEFLELAAEEGVEFHTFDQCQFGCAFEKTTDLLSNIDDDIMEPFHQRCSHAVQQWIVPWNGKRVCAKHPPLRGRQMAIPIDEWNPGMLRKAEPTGQFLTRSTAAYPADMNWQLAKCLREACERAFMKKQKKVRSVPTDQQVIDSADALDPKVKLAEPLSGQRQKDEVDERYSLRNVHKWISPRMVYIGKQIQNVVEAMLDDKPALQQQLMECLGKHKTFPDEVQLAVDALRLQVRDLLVRNKLETMAEQCSVEPVDTQDYQTVIRAELLTYWAQCVEDPAAGVSKWLMEGAPAGIGCDTTELDGICPKVDDEPESFMDLTTDYNTFVNYTGVEENEEAYQALTSYADKGYLRVFDSLSELEQHVGAKPTLSKLGCIVKQKVNHETGTVTTKTRIILDCKRSLVSKVAKRTHKSVLPRVSDAIQSTLAMQSDCRQGDSVTFLVADVVDAFWLVPLNIAERKFFCAKLRGKFYCLHRTAQGSRAAPLTFAAVIALASRWVQSIVSTPLHRGMHTEEARVQTYVDDPLFTIRGSEVRQRRLTAVILVSWLVMGFPLALHKATLGCKLTWIGVELSILPEGMEALVPEDKVMELRGLLHKMLQSNVVPKKMLRTVIGKAMSIASVIFCWRPFIQELYTALYVTDSHAPKECIWTKQVKHTILWLLTFLRGEHAGIRRVYSVRGFQKQLPMVTITWDASPFGMGSTLQLDGVFVEYFAIEITADDENILGVAAGQHEGQQTWEALAGLVALRHWAQHWHGQRARLQIRSDNVGALVMLIKLKGGSKALTLIAREYSLDLGQAQWKPDIVTHVPGIANTTCDMLSRKLDPTKTFKLPDTLKNAREVQPGQRPLKWWKTLVMERQMMHPADQQQNHGGAEEM